MKQFTISQSTLSELFWHKIFSHSEDVSHRREELQRALELQEELRPKADYNTGSITFCAAWSIYSITNYFVPSNIVEIGTFIGKSTLSMAMALDHCGRPGLIQTCDGSNGFDINWAGRTTILQNFKTISSDMMSTIDCPQDLLFVDGRLNDQDLDIIQTENFANCVFVFDDTEGVEKGTINQVLVDQKIKNRFVIYPPSNEILNKFNFYSASTISLSIPSSMVTFNRQG